MGAKHDHSAEVGTARQFYADVARPRDAREQCEEGDPVEGMLRDEAAEKLRRAGCGAVEAQRYVEAVLGVLKARDKAVCGTEPVAAKEPAVGDMAWLRHEDGNRRLLQALSQIWAWPDSRKGLGALFFAMGRPLYGCHSMRKLAELRQVSVEDVSNVVEELQAILGLPRNALQKSQEAVKSYDRSNGARVRETADKA